MSGETQAMPGKKGVRILCVILLFACGMSSLHAQEEFVGSGVCAQCHMEETASWQTSHHFQAMAEANSETVLGDFSDATFDYFGTLSTFTTRDGRYFVTTDNSAGEIEEFEIKYTFGVFPLQQYLVEFPDGRLQTLSITWDSRPQEDGGQRWYHLYPDEEVDFEDPLHWTGAFQNWNSRCASCHSTNLEKNYDREENRYATSWSEINVSCESCHGQGAEHVAWARSDSPGDSNGLLNNLRPAWSPVGIGQNDINNLLETINNNAQPSVQKEVCASCHSRRAELAHRDLGESFLDQHQLSMLTDPLYYPDGQIQDEVYVYGSFLQSKMHQAQVSCSNCHDPHSQELVQQGNALCGQCHVEDTYNTQAHFFHEPDTAGAQCVNCHMPATTYMGVDDRRDHSFKIPDPFFSLISDTPNACIRCHDDRDSQWAADQLTAIKGRTEPYYTYPEVFHRVRSGDAFAMDDLLALAQDQSLPGIIRATALQESGRYPSEESLSAAIAAFSSPDAMVRANAVASLDYLQLPGRYQVLQPLLSDPTASVRIEIAQQLAGIPLDQIPETIAAQIDQLFQEYVDASLHNADMPGAMTDLGLFYINREELALAEQSFEHALRLSDKYLPAMLNLADLYRAQARDEEGEELLVKAVAEFPESADAHHSLGLLYIRQQRMEDALPRLADAVELAPDNPRYVLVYSLALERLGQLGQAVNVLRTAVDRFPNDSQLYELLNDYRSRQQ